MAPRSLVRLALLALLWGSSFLWIKLALDGLSPVQLVLVRLALGAAVLVLVVRVRRLRLPHDKTTWLHLTVAALIANAIPYLLFAIGEQTVSSSLAGALNATMSLTGMKKHIRLLEEANLVTTEKVGRARRCTLVRYAFEGISTWLHRLDRFGQIVERTKGAR